MAESSYEIIYLLKNKTGIKGLQDRLCDEGLAFKIFKTKRALLGALYVKKPSIVIADLSNKRIDAVGFVRRLKEIDTKIPVMLLSSQEDVRKGIETLRAGAEDYFTPPFKWKKIVGSIYKTLRKKQVQEEIVEKSPKIETLREETYIVGESPKFKDALHRALAAAKTDAPVLLIGETGTGKELFARLIHERSRRKESPFVPLNCGAVPEELIEAELFGYKRGAFTGASSNSLGLFRASDTGTLFLDEISEMAIRIQAKLLRAIETRYIRPIGFHREVGVDVRILASSNCTYRELGEKLRRDLFYRFVIVIEIPPLREHKEDIPLLLNYFIEKFSEKYSKTIVRLTSSAQKILIDYHWPGNVRELQNLLEKIFTFGPPRIVDEKDVLSCLPLYSDEGDDGELYDIMEALHKSKWNKKEAAQILGISRATLYRKLEKYGVSS